MRLCIQLDGRAGREGDRLNLNCSHLLALRRYL